MSTNAFINRMLALVGVVGAILASWLPYAAGMPIGYAASFGFLVIGLTSVLVGHRAESPRVTALGYALLLIGTFSLAVAVHQSLSLNVYLLFAVFVVAELLLFSLLHVVGRLLGARHHLLAWERRINERRRLAAERGWRFQESDDELPAWLGGTQYRVTRVGKVFGTRSEPIPAGTRARGVLAGELNGIAFTAFDLVPPDRRGGERTVTTAWMVRLPHPLPLFPSTEVFRPGGENPMAAFMANADMDDASRLAAELLQRGSGSKPTADDASEVRDPDYVRALMSPEVTALTRGTYPSWWISGSVLATAHNDPHGANVELLLANAEGITRLASLLNWPALMPFVTSGGGKQDPVPQA